MTNFRMIDAPDKTPGVDYLTRTSVGPFIDTGRDAPKHSGRGLDRIYISLDTLKHMADVAGIAGTADEGAVNEAYRRGLTDGITAATGVGLADLVDHLDRIGSMLRGLADSAREQAQV